MHSSLALLLHLVNLFESSPLSDLKHTNLPRVYDHFTDPIHWYLVMDFIEGETLEEYLKRLPTTHLSLDEVLDIGLQLCTVAYLCSYVLEERLVLQYGNAGLVKVLKAGGGAGPFTLSSYTDSELDLTVNTNYYSAQPQLQKVVFSFYRDTDASYQAYRAGIIDMTVLPFDVLDSSNSYDRVPELTERRARKPLRFRHGDEGRIPSGA